MDELGPRGGFPVLYLHGLVGSSLRRCPDVAPALERSGVRLIAPPRRARDLTSAAAEVLDVADAHGLERFGVLGVSAGGPVALACARMIDPHRLAASAVVAGTVPIEGGCTRLERGLRAAASGGPVSVAVGAPAARVLKARGAAAAGARAMLADGRMAIGPRPFAPEDVGGEVHVWHGARDSIVPLPRALAHARRLPFAQLTVLLDAGHFFLREQMGAVLGGLRAAAEDRDYAAVPAA